MHPFILSGYFYSASPSPLLLWGAPVTARILCRSFTPNRHRQLRANYLPKVPTWRLERDSNLFRRFQAPRGLLACLWFTFTDHCPYNERMINRACIDEDGQIEKAFLPTGSTVWCWKPEYRNRGFSFHAREQQSSNDAWVPGAHDRVPAPALER